MEQTGFAGRLDMGHERKREVKDFSRVTPVFTAGAITEMGKASDKAGLKGRRGVLLHSERLLEPELKTWEEFNVSRKWTQQGEEESFPIIYQHYCLSEPSIVTPSFYKFLISFHSHNPISCLFPGCMSIYSL